MLEASLLNWLSWFVLLSMPKDGLKAYVFRLAVLLAKGEKSAFEPIYLCSLFARLDECVGNILRLAGHYDVVTHVDSTNVSV